MRFASLEHTTIGYDADRPVLQHISFSVPQGEFLSLLGPYGSGKAALLRLVDRIFPPQRGDINLFEQNIKKLKRSQIAERVSFVSQANAALSPITAFEVILMGRSPHLLEEPNAHLELSHKIDMYTILRRYSKQHRVSVVKVLVDANPVTHAPGITPLPTDHSSSRRALSSEVATHTRR